MYALHHECDMNVFLCEMCVNDLATSMHFLHLPSSQLLAALDRKVNPHTLIALLSSAQQCLEPINHFIFLKTAGFSINSLAKHS